jgi:lysophospholipase L1-like esterase
MTKIKIQSWAVLSVLVLIASVVVMSQIFHSSLHTLNQIQDWTSYKTMGIQGVMGSVEFLNQRQAVANNQLNLGEWHGHNFVFWNAPQSWEQLEFEFSLDKDAYLWIIFALDGSRRSAFRLSRHKDYPSGFFHLDRSGKILNRSIWVTNLQSGWNTFKINFGDPAQTAFLNSEAVFQLPNGIGSQKMVYLGNGLFPVSVDNIRIKTRDSVIIEDFSPRFQWRYLIGSLAIYCLLYFLCMVLVGQGVWRQSKFRILTTQITVLGILVSYQITDKYIIASRYAHGELKPFNRIDQKAILEPFEKYRVAVSSKLSSTLGVPVNSRQQSLEKASYKVLGIPTVASYWNEEMVAYASAGAGTTLESFVDLAKIDRGDINILFMGTSQTWGAGAESVEKNFVAQFSKKLFQRLKLPNVTLNISKSGSTSGELLNIYQGVSKLWQPDLVVINLSNNDLYTSDFKENLKAVSKINKEKNVNTVFILEANDREFRKSEINRAHAEMKKVAEEEGISVFDMHGYLSSPEIYDSGILWMDMVHLSQYGHNVVAEWLVDQARSLVAELQMRKK